MRAHLATLVEDFRRHDCQTAVISYRANRRYVTTYARLATLAARFAAELARRGIHPGERVVLWGENSAEWIAAFFGCLLRGVIAVPLDVAGSPEFAVRVVAEVAPKLIVGDLALLNLLPEAALLSFQQFQQLLPAEPLFAVDPAVTEETPIQIIFTSGTTSEPKGIVHTHRNVLASLGPIEREMQKYLKYERWVHPLRFLHTLPLSHVFGQFMGLWVPPLLGAQVHFDSRMEASRMVATIHRERISVLAAVPRVLELMRVHLLMRYPGLGAELLAAKGEPSWRHWWRFRGVHRALGFKFWAIVCGGASLPTELEEFWNTLGFALIQGYGLTETAALVTLNHPFKIGKGTIGQPLPGREVRLGAAGEIQVRGPMLSTATWQGGELRPSDQEWFNTGDLAAQDASGELRFVGRTSDVIVSPSGMNIHAADLEAALARQPGMRACAVVACPFAAAIEPVAVAIFSGGDEQLAAAVRAANTGLAEYQQIRRWLRWPEISFPYTSTGKLLRRKIAEWACEALAGRMASPVVENDALLALISSVTGEQVAKASNASLLSEDLRLDSLGRVQLQSLVEERLGVELPDNAVEVMRTLGELRALIKMGNPYYSGHHCGASHGEMVIESSTSPGSMVGEEWKDHGEDGQLEQIGAQTSDQQFLRGTTQFPNPDQHLYPHWPWWIPIRLLRVLFIEGVMRPLVWLLASPRVIYNANELPADPMLLIANHISTYDAALVLYALPPKLRRRVAIAMSGEMLLSFRRGRQTGEFRLRQFGPVAYLLISALFNAFPLPRSSGFRRSFAHAGEALDRGYSVLVFPEGHRSVDGHLQPFRPGIGLLAQQSQVAVLPVALRGMSELKQRQRRWFRSGKLEIHVGKVMAPDLAADASELTRLLEEAARKL